MALLEPGERRPEYRCSWGHLDCSGHGIKPDLSGLPNADPPKAGRCRCGELDYLWHVAKFDQWLCAKCLRGVMRRATWPKTIRFPDEVG